YQMCLRGLQIIIGNLQLVVGAPQIERDLRFGVSQGVELPILRLHLLAPEIELEKDSDLAQQDGGVDRFEQEVDGTGAVPPRDVHVRTVLCRNENDRYIARGWVQSGLLGDLVA